LRRDVVAAFDQQRELNAAVTRALEIQDKLNREQTASLLLLALDVLACIQADSATAAPPTESTAPPAE
jgi:hypothetical protein